MRRTAFLAVLLATLVPAAAWAVDAAVVDGTLSVRNGDGLVRLDLDRGVAIGRIGAGRLELIEPKDFDCEAPVVWDDGERALPEETLISLGGEDRFACVFRGENIRFRLVGSDGNIFRLQGLNISVSAVGRGRGTIRGRADDKPDGTWSLNGLDHVSLPAKPEVFRLAAPNPVD